MNSMSDAEHQTTKEEAGKLLDAFDIDGDGKLSFIEFVALYKDVAGEPQIPPESDEHRQLQRAEQDIESNALGGDPDMPPPTPAATTDVSTRRIAQPQTEAEQAAHTFVANASLAGKCALVTGAAGAIGSAVARAFHGAGINVAMLDVSSDELASQTAELSGTPGGRLLPLTVDISNPDAIDAAVKRVRNQAGFGMPDILINVAGILSNNKLEETSCEEWQRVMNVNVTSAFLLCQACCPAMAERGWGRVVNITSWAWKSGGLTAVRIDSTVRQQCFLSRICVGCTTVDQHKSGL